MLATNTWTIRERPDAEMANTMLEEACATLGPGEAPVIHSDRGCHYRWPGRLPRFPTGTRTGIEIPAWRSSPT